MNEKEILSKALEVQAAQGPGGKVTIFLDRLPIDERFTKRMRLISGRFGPFGKIVEIKENGTEVEFKAGQIIAYFGKQNHQAKPKRATTDKTVQIHPYISQSLDTKIKEAAAKTNVSISALIETALQEFIGAEACSV